MSAARIGAIAASVAAAGLLASPASAEKRYRYTIETRGDVRASVGRFATIADATLSDIRGWTLHHNVRYVRVASRGHFRLILASPAAVAAAHPICSATWSCRVGNQVLINERRWRWGTPTWPLSLREYRSYVINHEVGHWLGLGHARCGRSGAVAPVMMQQSKGLAGCRANVWPKRWERNRVAWIRRVGGWPVPPRKAPCTIVGTPGDDVLTGTSGSDVLCGGDGADRLRGLGGHDVLRGGRGGDILHAGYGSDRALGGPGNDRVIGWGGRDSLEGNNGDDVVRAGGGADVVTGGRGRDQLLGDRGDDTLRGGADDDRLAGSSGRDRLYGQAGDDVHGGGVGYDVCRGGPGSDSFRSCEDRDR